MPYSGAKSGFRNAPITKALLFCVSGCSLVAYLSNRKSLFQLQLNPQITTNHEFWRLLTSNVALTTSSEYFFGSIAIYQLRIIEQQFGSSKYAAFFFISTTLSTIFEVGTLLIGRSYEFTIPPGPYGFIFAALYQYMKIIPSIHQYKLLGLPFSEKIIVYFMGALPLLAFQYPHSIIAAMCGILSGVIYRNNIFMMKKWRFPRLVNRFASRFILPLLSTTSSTTIASSSSTTGRSSFTIDNRLQSTASSSSPSSSSSSSSSSTAIRHQAIVDEEHIANLRAMFPQSSQEIITQALETANNDINRAAQFLLDHHL